MVDIDRPSKLLSSDGCCCCDCDGCRNGFQELFTGWGGTDAARAGIGGAFSSTAQGSLDFFSIDIPFGPELFIETGVSALGTGVIDRGSGFVFSPSLTSSSTALSTFPFMLLSISVFLALSLKPMSRRCASFALKLLSTVVILMPNSLLGLLSFFGLGRGSSRSADLSLPLYAGDRGGVKRSGFCRGNVELDDRRVKPNFFDGLGGKSGGSSVNEPRSVPVLPVFCLVAGAALRSCPDNARVSYFCLMYFSTAASTSSASIGMSGLTFFGLYSLLLARLPTFFMFSTCSTLQLSMDKLFTFDT